MPEIGLVIIVKAGRRMHQASDQAAFAKLWLIQPHPTTACTGSRRIASVSFNNTVELHKPFLYGGTLTCLTGLIVGKLNVHFAETGVNIGVSIGI